MVAYRTVAVNIQMYTKILLCLSLLHWCVCPVGASTGSTISIPVFYATNRQRLTGRAQAVYSKKRRYLAGLEYGQCSVLIPAHGIDFDPKRDYKMGWRASPMRSTKIVVDSVKSEFRTDSEFFDELKNKAEQCGGAVVFVHGYNTGFDGALEGGAQFAATFRKPVVVFSWPSSEEYQGYCKDECNIEWSLPHYKRLVNQLEDQLGTKNLTLVAHSMGNRLLAWTMRDRSESAHLSSKSIPKFADVVLTSPDIDTGTFKNYALAVCENADNTWVLTSARDNALRGSQLAHERKRLGMPGPDGIDADWRQPPIVPGLTTVEFTILDSIGIGHTIQYRLISDLALKDAPGIGFALIPEQKEGYKWSRLVRK